MCIKYEKNQKERIDNECVVAERVPEVEGYSWIVFVGQLQGNTRNQYEKSPLLTGQLSVIS